MSSEFAFRWWPVVRGSTILLAVVLGILSDGYSARAGIITFDPAGSIDTEVSAINNKGDITGGYVKDSNNYGFLRDRKGSITTFQIGNIAPMSINGEPRNSGILCSRKLGPTRFYALRPRENYDI